MAFGDGESIVGPAHATRSEFELLSYVPIKEVDGLSRGVNSLSDPMMSTLRSLRRLVLPDSMRLQTKSADATRMMEPNTIPTIAVGGMVRFRPVVGLGSGVPVAEAAMLDMVLGGVAVVV